MKNLPNVLQAQITLSLSVRATCDKYSIYMNPAITKTLQRFGIERVTVVPVPKDYQYCLFTLKPVYNKKLGYKVQIKNNNYGHIEFPCHLTKKPIACIDGITHKVTILIDVDTLLISVAKP